MESRHESPVKAIEIVEDLSATARCDEGFLRLRRLRCQNLREDGGKSRIYRVDVVDRPFLDAVAVLVTRTESGGVEVLTRPNLRPAAYFRRGKDMAVLDGEVHLTVQEIVAGLLEPTDHGESGIRRRAAAEVREEAGFDVSPDEVRILGAPFFAAPGILSEKIFVTTVDVTGKSQASPTGDGSPMEEKGAATRWWRIDEARRACARGELPDAKTEIAITRFLDETKTKAG